MISATIGKFLETNYPLRQWAQIRTYRSADRTRGQRKGATSKIVKNCHDKFQHFSTTFGQGKNSQKVKTFIPATEPPCFRKVSEGFLKGFLKGSLKGFRRVLEGVSQGPFKAPFQEGVEIDDALGFPGL